MNVAKRSSCKHLAVAHVLVLSGENVEYEKETFGVYEISADEAQQEKKFISLLSELKI